MNIHIGDTPEQLGSCLTANAVMIDGKIITKQQISGLIIQNAELVAQVSRMQTFIRMSATKWMGVPEVEPTFLSLLRVANQQPEDALRNIQAEAVDKFSAWLIDSPAIINKKQLRLDIFKATNQYADSIRRGDV